MAIKSYYATKFTWKETHIWVRGYKTFNCSKQLEGIFLTWALKSVLQRLYVPKLGKLNSLANNYEHNNSFLSWHQSPPIMQYLPVLNVDVISNYICVPPFSYQTI